MARTHAVPAFFVLAFLALAGAATAQEPYNHIASVLGTVGGSLDDGKSGLANTGFQVGFALVTDRWVRVGVRVGTLDFGSGEGLEGLFDPSLEYVNVAGEYRFPESFYDSGLFFGLGAYRIEGERLGRTQEDTALGLVLGATGDFEISRHWSVLGELALHVLDSSTAQLLLTGHGGIAYSF